MKKMILLLLMSFAIGLAYPVEANAALPFVDQDELHYVDKVIIASMFINDDVIFIDCDNNQSAVMSHYSFDFTRDSKEMNTGPYTMPLYVEPLIEGRDPSGNYQDDNKYNNSPEANPYLLYRKNVVNNNNYWQLE